MSLEPVVVTFGKARWMVKTSCYECFIEVEATEQGNGSPWIELKLHSTHTGWWARGWGARIKQAWRILQGDWPWFFDLNTVEETDGLISALNLARMTAFGPLQGWAAFSAPNNSSTSFDIHIPEEKAE